MGADVGVSIMLTPKEGRSTPIKGYRPGKGRGWRQRGYPNFEKSNDGTNGR